MRAKEFIAELNMSPGNLGAFLKTPIAQSIQVGFEAEMCFSRLDGVPSEEGESVNDYTQDEDITRSTDLADIGDFFRMRNTREIQPLEKDYNTYLDEQLDDYVSENIDSFIYGVERENPDLDPEEDRDRIWDLAHEKVTAAFQDYAPSVGEFLLSNRIKPMAMVENEYGFDWPHQTQTATPWQESADSIAQAIYRITGKQVEIFSEYHQGTKDISKWYIEPDGSISGSNDEHFTAEIVSPPMPASIVIPTMNKLFATLRSQFGAYTNKSTGLHIGVSMNGSSSKNLDYVKLALFLGDDYILQQFGREMSSYARSSLKQIQMYIETGPERALSTIGMMRAGLMHRAGELIATKNSDRTMSINVKNNYVEFRSMGNDYLNNLEKVENTILRYIRAYAVAVDPNAEKQEYAKKLTKLINSDNNDDLRVFINYMAGGKNDIQTVKAILANRQGRGSNASYPNLQLQRSAPPKLPPDKPTTQPGPAEIGELP